MLRFGLWVKTEVSALGGTVLVSGCCHAALFKGSKCSPVSLLVGQAGTVSALSLVKAANQMVIIQCSGVSYPLRRQG